MYRQGAHLLDEAGGLVAEFGRRALVVADGRVRDLYGSRLTAALRRASVEAAFSGFSGETSPDELDRRAAIGRAERCDVVIGLGGGKAQDGAKAVKRTLDIPIVVVPTVAASDAATSRLAITYTDEGEFLGPLFMRTNPDAILVDTAIITNAPVRFFIAGIGDALSTLFEAEQCRISGATNFFDARPTQAALAIAERCFRTVWDEAEQAVRDVCRRRVTEAVERVVEANILLSGIGFEGCGVAAAHAISQGFTRIPELSGALHGEEVAVALLSQLVLEGRGEEYLTDVFDFYRRVGIPGSIRMLGLSEPRSDHYEEIARFACRIGSRVHNMASRVTADAVVAALRTVEALAMHLLPDNASRCDDR